jgi:predicted transposase YdaD
MAELVVADREAAIEQSWHLIQQIQVDAIASGFQENVLKLIQAVIVCKLGYSSLQELQAMFTLDDVKKTRLFQEIAAEAREKGKLEGKLEAVSLIKGGVDCGENC